MDEPLEGQREAAVHPPLSVTILPCCRQKTSSTDIKNGFSTAFTTD
ncbi:hypothetical protein [Streptomyces mirabilis]|uniref:Uncharacterized protein n=1 Tax=Streptomyces mirabilis TaxID=68239 RepID=A0ABU3UBJ5_9ACTN|nr:hypothetical protein [Streptomyces mirabilis]MDU8990969.1 hypothetical protein [Streptomyces mirabilis]